ncbi:MAG: phage tail sheath subtilisin-like domain-containing protein [Eubacterium sp.]|nr:phage tail sheath subtilisin-like domain-containing protein [Candidatus Colimonas fimequi]
MGAPNITIAFYEQAIAAIQRGDKGVIAMLIVDSSVEEATVYTVLDVTDVPSALSAANKKQINMALIGYQNAPKKIIVVAVPTASDYADGLDALELLKWDYLVCPSGETDNVLTAVSTWIKGQRTNNHKIFKAIIPNVAADSDGIIDVTMGYTDADGTELTAEQACSRIAGIIAGTPLTMSCTYAPIPEAIACAAKTQAELDAAVDAGKIVLMWDGEKVKIVRGVNSFVTTTADKGESFKKIKLVEIMDAISNDIRTTAQDNYIGKFANSYDNKCLLVTAINGYFDTLVQAGVLASGLCDIDVDANKTWIKARGGKFVIDGETIDIEDASEEQIRMANTGSQVLLKATISMLDALEDIKLDIYIG